MNRTHGHNKPDKKLAPSVRERCDCHVTLVRKVMRILPITSITIEMAPFDTQRLKAQLAGKDAPKGADYQHGEAEGTSTERLKGTTTSKPTSSGGTAGSAGSAGAIRISRSTTACSGRTAGQTARTT